MRVLVYESPDSWATHVELRIKRSLRGVPALSANATALARLAGISTIVGAGLVSSHQHFNQPVSTRCLVVLPSTVVVVSSYILTNLNLAVPILLTQAFIVMNSVAIINDFGL